MNNKRCPHGLFVDAKGMHIPTPKKYEVVEHETGIKYEVTEHQQEPKPEPEVKPVSFKDIERLYKKEFPEPTITNNVNEVKKLKQLIDNAHHRENLQEF